MHISADSIGFPANHKSNLTVSLQTDQTIDNMASGFLQFLCPVDIILFVKSCL